MQAKIFEMDLYKPIQSFFIKEGYEVYGEVNDCDMAMIRGDILVVVELKLTLNVQLLIQATKRQKLTDLVYIAIPKPSFSRRSKRWHDLCHLVKRLELGLIVVSFSGKRKKTEVIFDPIPFDRARSMQQNKRKREALLKEINGRSSDLNIGGSSRAKIMTAYKENCVQIACYLDKFGELSPKALKDLGTGEKTSSILTKNYYRWFERIRRGTYTISEKGKQEYKLHPELVQYFTKKLDGK
ncbi:DUF2161 domain-containing phosphodiesterase [Sutcliffiella rhizosphaerae]|uniref:Uncharacterized protein n=1 Tax=Sutcliffiella rhizosphaerae TaxID=2880967 RepID=A0ABM8YT78_9BACI|nr:DUF2161 family putative PD-(D/E)XK-type phosphodiesterase [Sutcliffiella rhizosphaerae]CAG9622986.1 hypothetical protein BACCIP111883_03781 [Sutcliffiella rhizosphaerae]